MRKRAIVEIYTNRYRGFGLLLPFPTDRGDARMRITFLLGLMTFVSLGLVMGTFAIHSAAAAATTPLTANFTSTPASAGSPTAFNASASGGSPPYSFSWNFADGSAFETGNLVTHTFTSPGLFTVVLTATDSKGIMANPSQSVSVASPGGGLGVDFSLPPATSGSPVTFTASLSRGDLTPYYYSWDFGDGMNSGSPSLNAFVTHIYSSPGTFIALLTVSYYCCGFTAYASHLVSVQSTLSPPVFLSGEVHWIHHLTLAKTTSMTQNFTIIVFNPAITQRWVQVSLAYAGQVFLSPVTQIPAMTKTTFMFVQDIPITDVGTRLCFTATLYWGDVQTNVSNISPDTKSGCFAVA